MESQGEGLYPIGEVARMSGLPVKTIRFYSNEGLLPPARVTEARYRLYDAAGLARLELIRTLRAAGFDLATIRRLLEGKEAPREALRLQLEATEVQHAALARQRALLRAALDSGSDAILTRLHRVMRLARLSAAEREAFLTRQLARGFDGLAVDPGWRPAFWSAMLELPEELDEERLEAWLELAELVSDEGFGEALRAQTGPFAQRAPGGEAATALERELGALYREAVDAVRNELPPEGERGRRLAAELARIGAAMTGRTGDPAFPAWWLRHLESTADPRMERYWELIATLRSWTEPPPIARAHAWLLEGLRSHVAERGPARSGSRAPARGVTG